jgi:hypothetical protein
MTYPSKVDMGITLLVGWGMLISIVIGAVLVWDGRWLGWLVMLLTPGVLRLVALPVHYEITDDRLLVRSGLVRWRIPIAAIVNVEPTQSLLSAPAWSLDRLEVRYWRGGGLTRILISPRDKAAFLAELVARDPALVLDGDRLSRTA